MKYLPIFQELFESGSIIFMLIGLVFATFIGIKMNDIKKIIIGLVSSFALYAACEFASIWCSMSTPKKQKKNTRADICKNL